MDNLRREFLDIVAQVRSHLEYQQALGVTVVEASSVEDGDQQQSPGNHRDPQKEQKRVSPEKAGAGEMMTPEVKAAAAQPGLDTVRKELEACTRCKLCSGRKTIVFGEGNPEAALVFIGHAPGPEEDEQGRPFVGPAGQLLTDIIVKGMQFGREDVYLCTMAKCRTPGDRQPEPDEIASCEPFLVRQLRLINPKVIVALGSAASNALLGNREKISSLRGKWHAYQGIRLMPTYHPAYLLKNPAAKKEVWGDIRKVLAELQMRKG